MGPSPRAKREFKFCVRQLLAAILSTNRPSTGMSGWAVEAVQIFLLL